MMVILNIPQWKELRNKLFEERGLRCEACGGNYPKSYFDIHHIISREDISSNLIVLCKRCHTKMPKRWEKNLNSKEEIIEYIWAWKRR